MMVTPVSRSARTSCHMSRRSSTSTPAVGSSRNRICGSCDKRLGDQHPALHAAGERHDLAVLLVPQRQVPQHLLDMGRVAALAEQAAAEAHRRPHGLEGVGGQLLRHEADLARARRGSRATMSWPSAVTVPARRVDDAADDADQRRLAGAVRAEQREDLARGGSRGRCPSAPGSPRRRSSTASRSR